MKFNHLATFLENVLRVSTSLEGDKLESLNIDYWKREMGPTERSPSCGTTLCILGHCVEDSWFREHIFEPPYWKAVEGPVLAKGYFTPLCLAVSSLNQGKAVKREPTIY